jgi:hypothetical protein
MPSQILYQRSTIFFRSGMAKGSLKHNFTFYTPMPPAW